jgi:predicted Zn-dependent protease
MVRMKRFVATLVISCVVLAAPARAQSILRDAETESLFADMAKPIVLAAGLDPKHAKVVLIQDDSINAFTAGGQTVYVHSGLMSAADNANQVQGVIAHEFGHVADGHVALGDAGGKPAMGISILSMVLGIAAMAAGAGEAGAGILAAGQQAAMGNYLSFSRTVEATADASGAMYLNRAGISGKGMLDFFKKLQSQEYAYGLKNIDPYAQSHPLSGTRIATLSHDLQAAPSWNAAPDAALDARFQRVKAKLRGYVDPTDQTLRTYPQTDQSIPAHYARAYAWHKGGYPEKAAAETAALIKAAPHDPYFLEIQGQILLESGKPREALVPLREATQETNFQPLIATTFGHALIATEDKANYPEAEKVLRQAVARDDENPFAWYQLGTVYDLKGDVARAALATAERASMTGDPGLALRSAQTAMGGIPPNTPDWIRAQDILLVSQDQLGNKKKRR